MRSSETSDLRKMGKRRFLKVMSAIGVSAGTLSAITPSTLAKVTSDPEQEVPRLKYRIPTDDGVEHVYYTIPRDEWERQQAAYDAGRTLAREIAREENYPIDLNELRVAVTTTSGHTGQKAVHVEYQPTLSAASQSEISSDDQNRIERRGERIEEELPNTVSGTAGKQAYNTTVEDIPVIFETNERLPSTTESTEVTPATHRKFHHDYDPILGGIRINTSTACAPAEHPDYGDVLIGSGHAFDENEEVEMRTETVGTVEEAVEDEWTGVYSKRDYALIDVDPSNDTSGSLADDNGSSRMQIAGSVGKDYIEDIEGGSEEVHLQGTVTGLDSGTVHSIDVFNNNFRTRSDRSGGDSGGPHYIQETHRVYGDVAMIAGIHQGPYSRCPRFCSTYANATFWEHAVDEFDIEVKNSVSMW